MSDNKALMRLITSLINSVNEPRVSVPLSDFRFLVIAAVRNGEITVSKGAELLGMPREMILAECGEDGGTDALTP